MQMPSSSGHELVGHNQSFASALDFASKVANRDCPLLIIGETGTGKDEVARLVHALSARAGGPFISLNCAALPEALVESELFGYERGAFTGAGRSYAGRFAAADGGTLFLDELGDLPLASQAKLLRAIEHHEVTPLGSARSRRVNLRIVAATHQRLEEMVCERRFRQDLFYRLNVARIHLPPLRERRDDILELAAHFMGPLRRTGDGARVGWFDAAAMHRLLTHPWPGNVRELRNVIEAIFIDPPQGPITERSLPSYLTPALQGSGADAAGAAASDERLRIIEALTATHWNKAAAARDLKWSRVTLYRKMARLDIPGGAQAGGSDNEDSPSDCARQSASGPGMGPNVAS